MLSLRQFLSDHVLAELVGHHRKPITINADATVEEALKSLQNNNVTFLPVIDNGEMLGFLTTLDLLAYVSFASFGFEEDPTEDELKQFKDMSEAVRDVMGVGTEIKAGVAVPGVFVFGSDTSVNDIFDPMTIGIQKALVTVSDCDNGDKYRVLTQSDLLRFLYLHESRLPDCVFTSVAEIGLGTVVPKTVSVNDKTLHALRELSAEKGVEALAVVDDRGRLVSTLSPFSVSGLTQKNIKDVLLPVGDFLRHRNFGQIEPVVSMKKDGTLSTAMAKILIGGVNRVWIVDDGRIPIGQISTEDILVKFGPFPFRRMSYVDTQRLLSEAKL